MMYFSVTDKQCVKRTYNKRCNYVDFSDPNYVVLEHKEYTNSIAYDVIAIIPHSEIARIEREEDD